MVPPVGVTGGMGSDLLMQLRGLSPLTQQAYERCVKRQAFYRALRKAAGKAGIDGPNWMKSPENINTARDILQSALGQLKGGKIRPLLQAIKAETVTEPGLASQPRGHDPPRCLYR